MSSGSAAIPLLKAAPEAAQVADRLSGGDWRGLELCLAPRHVETPGALDAAIAEDVEHDLAPGRAARPQPRIEVGLAAEGLAAESDDDVSDPERRIVRRTVAGHSRDDHVAFRLLRRHAEPRSRGTGRAAASHEVGEQWLEPVDGHEKIARHRAARPHRIRHREGADADEPALAVQQGGTLPVHRRRRRVDGVVQQVLPVADEPAP